MVGTMAGAGVTAGSIAVGAGINALGNTLGTEQQAYHQKQLQEDQQEFAEIQAKNQIRYNVEQMRDLGLSPLMLFDHGNATGGGTGAGGQGHISPNNIFGNGVLSGINAVGNFMKDQQKIDLEEQKLFNQERIIDLKEKRLNNQINNGYYNKLNNNGYRNKNNFNIIDNIDDIEI